MPVLDPTAELAVTFTFAQLCRIASALEADNLSRRASPHEDQFREEIDKNDLLLTRIQGMLAEHSRNRRTANAIVAAPPTAAGRARFTSDAAYDRNIRYHAKNATRLAMTRGLFDTTPRKGLHIRVSLAQNLVTIRDDEAPADYPPVITLAISSSWFW